MIEAGLFFVLLGTAFMLFFIKTPYREGFMFVSCGIFLVLGTVIYSDADIPLTTFSSVNDGVTVINGNSTFYIVGDATNNYNESSKILAVFFIVIGIITGLIASVMFMSTGNSNGPK